MRPVSGDMRVADYLAALFRRRWWFLSVSLAVTGAATAWALLMTPVYRAEALVAPVQDESVDASSLVGNLGGLASIAGLNVDKSARLKDEAVALLRSRHFLESFIETEGLLPVLFPDAWDAGAKRWKATDHGRVPTLGQGYRYFRDRVLRVEELRTTGLLTISIEWSDRQQAARWANTVVARINETMRERAIAESEQSLRYLNEQLKTDPVLELKEVLFRLVESQVRSVTLAKGRPQYAFRVIDPAAVPEPDEFVRPLRLLMIVAGLFLGILTGTVVAILVDSFWARPSEAGRRQR